MKYGYNVFKTEVDDHSFRVAKSTDLKGCVGQGETIDEAVLELEENEKEWLETAEKYGISIPESTCEEVLEHSGKFQVRVAKSVHRDAVYAANREGISLNQYVNNAIVAAITSGSLINIVNSKFMMIEPTIFAWAETYQKMTQEMRYTINVPNPSKPNYVMQGLQG